MTTDRSRRGSAVRWCFSLSLIVLLAGLVASAAAALSICGNGIKEGTEQCDDNNNANGDGCDSNCLLEVICGDGLVVVPETCDDGNTNDGDGCSSDCMTVETGWICATPGSPCIEDCGDNLVVGTETCDDGNMIDDGNGCDANCQRNDVCGNGILESAFETCDDNNTSNLDGCNSNCLLEPGWICLIPGSACTEICGDNLVVGTETCDDGNMVDDGNGCDANCQRNDVCGNGILESAFEACDDNNTSSLDGCDSNCVIEAGWICPSAGSPCMEICGDNLIVGVETCDDGNTDPGDCCTETCQFDVDTCESSPAPVLDRSGLVASALILFAIVFRAFRRMRTTGPEREGSHFHGLDV